jgi:subtilisin family serine protease
MDPRLVIALATLSVLALPGCLQGIMGDTRSDWAYDMTQLTALADMGREGKGVTIAILDTGINVRHPSFDHLVDGNRSNGELVGFRDFLGDADGPKQAFDDDGHGSHVAGIIAARGGASGLAGVDLKGGAPGALLLVARVCSGEACGAQIIDDAVRWATNQGADVISMSLGGAAGGGILGLNPPTDLQNAINAAINRGVVVIASAGNNGPNNNNDGESGNDDVGFPSSIQGVISVGAVGRDGKVAAFSSRGSSSENTCSSVPLPGLSGRCRPNQKPEIVAPGVDILSAWTGKSFAMAQGTSQATPFVTAAVALMIEGRSLTSASDVNDVKVALINSAKKVDGQTTPHDNAAGYGALRARDALRAYTGQ